MDKLCVFAGTTEGRELVEFLCAQPVKTTACVATEYGQTLLEPAENLTIHTGRLNREEMAALFAREQFSLVVDATHPYASVVTQNICAACADTQTEYLRLLRSGAQAPEDSVFVPDLAGAVDYLNTREGNILLTTGSKELASFRGIREFAQRVYARVLPMEDSLRLCREAELPPAHIIAMQGPFSRALNVAMLRSVEGKFLVTKDSGTAGGFDEKIAAAREAGAQLVVIGRPPQVAGLTMAQVLEKLGTRFGFSWQPRVSIVGIGPGSREGMTLEALTALEQADCLVGASRMLETARPGQTVHTAIAPGDIADFIHTSRQYARFAVVMSGDTGFFSGTKKLLPLLRDCKVQVLPGISSLSYLCAKAGTSYEDVVPVSFHGREGNICREAEKHPRMFVLAGGENGMGQLCRRLTEGGLGAVKVTVGERLGYPQERITVGTAEELSHKQFHSLSSALMENPNPGAVVTHGLPDEAFARAEKVPMTKSEVRSVCLSKLRLTRNAVAWDVGAGTGSVSIEMALQAEAGRVFAIERKDEALDILRENAARFGLSNLEVVPGMAPGACNDLPAPTHVFLGGTSGNLHEILRVILEKNPEARIVATAIALESQAELTACMKAFSFRETEVVCLNVSKARKAGPYHLMTGQNPIYIFTMQGGICP